MAHYNTKLTNRQTYHNIRQAKCQGVEMGLGALNYSAIPNHIAKIISGYLIVWGAYTCVTCDINYISLPSLMLGIVMYMEAK